MFYINQTHTHTSQHLELKDLNLNIHHKFHKIIVQVKQLQEKSTMHVHVIRKAFRLAML
jgi:hypothetical protein